MATAARPAATINDSQIVRFRPLRLRLRRPLGTASGGLDPLVDTEVQLPLELDESPGFHGGGPQERHRDGSDK